MGLGRGGAVRAGRDGVGGEALILERLQNHSNSSIGL